MTFRPLSLLSPPRAAPRAMAVALLMVTVEAVVGCGVPLDDHAKTTSASNLPYDLASPAPAPLETVQPAMTATIFLIRRDELVSSTRPVTDPGDLTALVESLTAPPSAEEVGSGLRRALTDPGMIGSISRTGRLATVELTRAFDQLASREQVLALGQIVFTLTERDEVDQVRFSRNNEPLTVPTGGGNLVDGPVTRYDYRSLRCC